MEQLDEIWSDNDMEDLPFSTSVNEQLILDVMVKLDSENRITNDICLKVKQWIKFNTYINEISYDSTDEYKIWVHTVYSKLNNILCKTSI